MTPARTLPAMRFVQAMALTACAALLIIAMIPADSWASFLAHPHWKRSEQISVLGWTVSCVALLRAAAVTGALGVAMLALKPSRTEGKAAAALPATRLDWAVVALSMLAALAVRMPFIWESLWYDEIAAFVGYGIHGPGAAAGNYFTQANHPMQSVLSSCTAGLMGASELSLRLPSLAAGIALVPAMWWLGREAGSLHLARAAAVVVSLMPIAVLESTEARGYALMMLFSTLAAASALWGLRSRQGGAWSVYALVCALGVWSHAVTVVVPLWHGAWAAWHLMRARDAAQCRLAGTMLAALAVAGALTLAFYAPLLGDMQLARAQFAASGGNEPTLLGPQGGMMVMMLGGAWTAWAAAAGALVTIAGAVALRGNPPLARAVVLSLGGALLALLAPALGSWLYARFLCFAIPGIALLMAAGAQSLTRPRAPASIVGLACVALVWVASLASLPPRQPLREAMAYIADHRGADEPVIAVGLPDDVHQWYAVQHDLRVPGSGPYGSELAKRIRAEHPQWVLMLYPQALPSSVHEELRSAGFQPAIEFPGWIDQGDGRVVVLRRAREPR